MAEDLNTNHLPLTAMDCAMVAQTYPGRPMTTHHVLDVALAFSPSALRTALEHLVRECPSLRTSVREVGRRWVRTVDAFDEARVAAHFVVARDGEALLDNGWLDEGFDLSTQWPVRVGVQGLPGAGQRIIFTLHHHVTDGRGALSLFDWYLRTAVAAEGLGALPMSPFGAAEQTSVWEHVARRGARFWLACAVSAVRALALYLRDADRVFETPDAQAGAFGILTRDLDQGTWRALKVSADREGCTRNDLLVCAALKAGEVWRRERGLPCEQFRVLGVVDLREFFEGSDVLQNWMGTAEVDASAEAIRGIELPKLVSKSLREGRVPDKALAAPALLGVLGTLLPPAWFKGLFKLFDAERLPSMYSFLLSHIRPHDAICWPDAKAPQRLFCASTLPRKPGLGITVTTVGEHVTLALCWPQGLSSKVSMQRFFDALFAQLERQ